ncbi:pirin family protein [Sulfuricurvum sp.]|uniref:pirin family protein n=1 Tax=Sulfuricurvum sp. TaxID=2025608 RepID=UPI002617CE0E|nr:pirin family protein [Sulfuricurvum sp.]MDD4884739.1 pirin family protein [Sulfuricurvum sp.]
MQVTLHRAHERGIAEHGWLHSRFSFSFADYHNRERMGFGVLRVINDDIIEPGSGFGMHPHRDMEIITIVTHGMLEHKDSEGNHGIISAGEIQYMSAGSGVEHSEFNPSDQDRTELFQIWIYPHTKGLIPRYEQHKCDAESMNRWELLVSGDGRKGSLAIRQDACIKKAHLYIGHTLVSDNCKPGHGRLLLVMSGELEACGYTLKARDELQILGEESFEITTDREAQLLLFDLPMHNAPPVGED